MISEGEYFFRGAMRLSWGFATPNYLGAFLAGLLPLVWGAGVLLPRVRPVAAAPVVDNPRKRSKTKLEILPVRKWVLFGWCAVIGLELALWGALGATGSRGAAVAAGSGVVLWEVFRRLRSERSWRRSASWVGLRLLFCCIGFAVFSFGGRIAPAYLAQDASIGNRWLLWAGGAALCEGSPWHGWGTGESGHLFTQWLQPLDRPQEYKTMVNSYLHLSVEHGLPSLAGILAVLAGLVGWPLVAGKALVSDRWAGVCRAAACVWATWATANAFSTLYDDWRLWYAPGLAVVIVLISGPVVLRAHCSWRRWGLGVLVATLGVPTLVFVAGMAWQWHSPVRITRSKSGMVVLARRMGADPVRWGVMPDVTVLGGKYGHEIRRWGLAMNDPEWSAWIYDPRLADLRDSPDPLPNRWLVFGANVRDLDRLGGVGFVVIVHPRGAPPKSWRGKGMVLLNQVDEDGSSAAWTSWAESLGLRIYTISDIGLDARAAWPDAYLSRLGGTAR